MEHVRQGQTGCQLCTDNLILVHHQWEAGQASRDCGGGSTLAEVEVVRPLVSIDWC